MRKLFQTVTVNDKFCRVYRDAELDQYIVRFYCMGRHMDASDYFTSDKQDAMETALYAIDQEMKHIGMN